MKYFKSIKDHQIVLKSMNPSLEPFTPGSASYSSSRKLKPKNLSGKLLGRAPDTNNLNALSNLPLSNLHLYTIPSLQTTYELAQQPAKKAHILEMIQSGKETDNRGNAHNMRGWSSRAPAKGSERHILKARCGESCFLRPNDEGFPICPSPRMTEGNPTCEIDCGGVQAAYNRARQYHYQDIADHAQEILNTRCNK